MDEKSSFNAKVLTRRQYGWNSTARAAITVIHCDTYGLCLFHDENNTVRIYRGAFGKPRVGVGVSKKPPMKKTHRFEDAEFSFNSENLFMEINVVYF
ncbi:MAG: DUF2141 domain-containing protein [Vulcanimicrobiota bacterium]